MGFYLLDHNTGGSRAIYDGRCYDPKHPLKMKGIERLKLDEEERLTGHRTETITQYRLRRAFERWGGTKAEWNKAMGSGKNRATACLKDPGIMSEKEVNATMQLFGCTLEYLQGRTRTNGGKPDDPLPAYLLGHHYEYHLTDDQRSAVSELVLQFASLNFELGVWPK